MHKNAVHCINSKSFVHGRCIRKDPDGDHLEQIHLLSGFHAAVARAGAVARHSCPILCVQHLSQPAAAAVLSCGVHSETEFRLLSTCRAAVTTTLLWLLWLL